MKTDQRPDEGNTVAKGNAGNLLQHTVETTIAQNLAGDAGSLWLIATHAMAPMQSHDPKGALLAAIKSRNADSPHPVLRAYAGAGATQEIYPNTSKLIKSLGMEPHGVLCEVDDDKFCQLRTAHQHSLNIHHGCWRSALRDGKLACPERLNYPWMITMDPMTFAGNGRTARRNELDTADLSLLIELVSSYRDSNKPGALIIFCYSLRRSCEPFSYQEFQYGAIELKRRAEPLHLSFIETTDANRHVAAVLSTDQAILRQAKKEWRSISALFLNR